VPKKDDANKIMSYATWRKTAGRNQMAPELTTIFSALQKVAMHVAVQDMVSIAERANFVAKLLIAKKKQHKADLDQLSAAQSSVRPTSKALEKASNRGTKK